MSNENGWGEYSRLVLKELDSRSLGAIGRCDLLVIDSVHNHGFMQKELEIKRMNKMKNKKVNNLIIKHGKFKIEF